MDASNLDRPLTNYEKSKLKTFQMRAEQAQKEEALYAKDEEVVG